MSAQPYDSQRALNAAAGSHKEAAARNRVKRIIMATVAADLLLVAAGFVCWVGLTPAGGGWLMKTVVLKALDPDALEVGGTQGSLFGTFETADMVMAGGKIFPPGARLAVKRLRVNGDFLDWRRSEIHLEQGRLFLPASDPILFEARLTNGVWEAYAYGRRVDVEDLLGWAVLSSGRKTIEGEHDVHGTLSDWDLRISGPWSDLVMDLNTVIQRLASSDRLMSIEEAPVEGRCRFSIETSAGGGPTQCRLRISGGRLKMRHLVFEIMPSRIRFDRSAATLDVDIRGRTFVAGHEIVVNVKGSPDHPVLNVSSDPPQARSKIFSLLALGGALESPGEGDEGRMLAVDISRLFLLGSRGADLFKKLGLRSATVRWGANARGFGLEKRVGSRIGLTYGVEQRQVSTASQTVQTHAFQEIGAEIDSGRGVAVGIKQRLPLSTDTAAENRDSEGEVLLKFKKAF